MPHTAANRSTKFYARFKSESEELSKSIEGITDKDDKQRCASILLIRLIFVYFVQSKGLFDGDINYLRSELAESKRAGRNGFYFRLGEIFSRFDMEDQHGEMVQIPDAAFERVFDFFDQYGWRLEDDSPRDDTEITPYVLGHILEQHINQKQMGAYYTKDDITEYIAKNTIIPALLDRVRREREADFCGERSIWRLLQADPDRYIYPAVKERAKLPTETSRERRARLQSAEAARAKLSNGEILSIDDVITFNLDIRCFARDVIETCESAEFLSAFWRALESLTVLDPTCGSGAFLFAALNLLEPLYDVCLERMRFFLSDPERHDKESLCGFRKSIDSIEAEEKRCFILKAIINNNLFGVDIMQEAVEMCRLRFFLKLLAHSSIESMVEIGFNLRCGNALAGYAVQKDSLSKPDLDKRLAIESGARVPYEDWIATNKPFHWAFEFPLVSERGGFSCVIGNPPYVAATSASRQNVIEKYATADCPDIYAWVLERACHLLGEGGRSGQIVPLSLTFSRDFASCREFLFASYSKNWFSSFARIPAALFNFDVRIRNTIHIGHKFEKPARQQSSCQQSSCQYATRLHRWFEAARPHLFELIEYAPFTPQIWQNRIPKLGTRNLALAFEQIKTRARSTIEASFVRGATPHALHFKRTAYNWLNFCRRLPPCYDLEGKCIPHTKFSTVYFASARARDLAFLLLNGKLMLAFWAITGDDFDVTRRMFADFPVDLDHISDAESSRLLRLAGELEDAMEENVSFKLNAGKRVGTYNLAKCRDVTDQSDRIFAAHLGLEDIWADVELFYARIVLR
ncbi:MAG: hypothetical protein WBV94_31290 [Blastocatellia bacterium]